MDVDLRLLMTHLNPVCRRAMEHAAQLCVRHSHEHVNLAHLLLALIDLKAPDLRAILRRNGVEVNELAEQLRRGLGQQRSTPGKMPVLSSDIPLLLQAALLRSTLLPGQTSIRSGTVLLAVLETDSLRVRLSANAPALLQLSGATVRAELAQALVGSAENDGDAAATGAGSAVPREGPAPYGEVEPAAGGASGVRAAGGAASALDQYSVDLTGLARLGAIDPVRGRDTEIRQLIDVLLRRRQNNPILTGEAGVGKTAVVEGLAQRIVQGDVPPALRGVSIRTLDLALLQAGAGVRGEFENRIKSVIQEVKTSPTPVILFIDEAHQLIGAGGGEGQGDAANLLKPALARGELRTIAATTWAEYKRYVERDPALARRFQVVKVDEPGEEAAMEMLRGVVRRLQAHHGVEILDAAVRDAVRLSLRHLPGRQLPDKAISVLDTACARVALGQAGLPPELEALGRAIESDENLLAIQRHEAATGADRDEAIDATRRRVAQSRDRHATLGVKLAEERRAVEEIVDWRRRIAAHLAEGEDAGADAAPAAPRGEGGEGVGGPERDAALGGLTRRERLADMTATLRRLEQGLEALRDDEALVPVCVDSTAVAKVIADWTGVPAGRMLADELHTVLNLRERLSQRVVGQDEALDTVARRIRTYRADLDDPDKPVGVFLLLGPSGVGKTETACALADLLYGGERHLITVNMSEFQEAHSVSGLKGAPPGYVGYGRGGVLTEAVRRRPYSVVLLDEIEKAHPDVLELFFQVFDKGQMEDGEGVLIDFRNTLILMTSNAGDELIAQACGETPVPSVATLVERLYPELAQRFSPAFLARLVLVPYRPLGAAEIASIVELKLRRLAARVQTHHQARLRWDAAVTESLTRRCETLEGGARNVDFLLTETVLPELARQVLERRVVGVGFSDAALSVRPDGDLSVHLDEVAARSVA